MRKILIFVAFAGIFAAVIQASSVLASSAEPADKDNSVFVRIAGAPDTMHIGDSVRVAFRLFSDKPFHAIRQKGEPKASGATIRLLGRGYYQGQRQVLENGKRYYMLEYAAYVIVPRGKGMVSVDPVEFEAEVITGYKEQDIFDFFFGQTQYVTEKRELTSTKFRIRVTEAPLRSTESMMKSGAVVM